MVITGYIGVNYYKDYKFILDTEHYSNKSRKYYTNLTFEGMNNYTEFDYNFSDLKEFMDEFETQEKNLFKYFFNNESICFDTLEYDLSDNEWQEHLSTYPIYSTYPTIDEIIWKHEDLFDWNNREAENMDEVLSEAVNCENFIYYIKDVEDYTKEMDLEYLLENFLPYIDIELLKIQEIKKLHSNNELDTFIKYHTIFDDLTQDEMDYINLAVNYNNEGKIDVFNK